jgi:hypothetical protein
MKILTLPVVALRYSEKIGKTVVEASHNGSLVTVFTNGDQTQEKGLLVTVQVNEVGDKFIASRDSTTLDDKKKPVYLKGDVVTRQKESVEFKSFSGNNAATQFAQGASAFGLQLVVQMS